MNGWYVLRFLTVLFLCAPAALCAPKRQYSNELGSNFGNFECHIWKDYYSNGKATNSSYKNDASDSKEIKQGQTDAHEEHILALGTLLWYKVDSDTTVEEVNSDDVVKSGMKVTKKAYACTTIDYLSSQMTVVCNNKDGCSSELKVWDFFSSAIYVSHKCNSAAFSKKKYPNPLFSEMGWWSDDNKDHTGEPEYTVYFSNSDSNRRPKYIMDRCKDPKDDDSKRDVTYAGHIPEFFHQKD